MQKNFGLLILCLALIAGCSAKSDNNERQQQNDTSLNIQEVLDQENVSPHYIETGNFSGDELKIINTLNESMKYSLLDDIPGIITLYSEDYPGKNDDYSDVHVLSITVSLDSPKFNFISDNSAEVFVDQSDIVLADPEKSVSTVAKIYFMVKENGEWKISSIQN
ncbi:hypothetical protein MNQ98_04605 [Paenibacillus sp. N3/727]|uniref:hypothetical protein n=1 Tax=Paenibacillus sp. N3/727 TaxID=2925845 RepID=UPI001F534812|nr:hypothetical protein [Paenibacillus sp. N3/727]UNK19320.1 hypothetical protein MNQ98_04605 [Paenibacillus sp. N3/727]